MIQTLLAQRVTTGIIVEVRGATFVGEEANRIGGVDIMTGGTNTTHALVSKTGVNKTGEEAVEEAVPGSTEGQAGAAELGKIKIIRSSNSAKPHRNNKISNNNNSSNTKNDVLAVDQAIT